MRYYEDPILGKGRAADVSGGTGSADYVGGARIAIGGETISFVNSATIQNVTGNSVTLEPDTAYKITATASAVTLNANVPAAGSWAYEGHAEIFVAGTGYIVTGANVVLANPLEPDAVNNCVLRFHDGTCIIDVEDHVYGYIVTSISGTTQGTLPYGITSATSNYIAFDATTNGSTIDLSGSTASAEKHLVGNGYTETTLTGAVDCGTSKFTVANLGLQNVQITGGTMTLGDAYIPSGSTVAVSGGSMVIEKVTGNGVIDLNKRYRVLDAPYLPAYATISGCTITNGVCTENAYTTIGGYGRVWDLDGVTITGNTATYGPAAYPSNPPYGKVKMKNCIISGNTGTVGKDIFASSLIEINDGNKIGEIVVTTGGTVSFSGSNTIDRIARRSDSQGGPVIISSGAIVDLTGNTNPTPIAPGGGVIVDGGTCTVLVGSTVGVVESSVIIEGGTYATIKNDGTTTV